MNGETKILVKDTEYGILFNNLALGEAYTRFNLNPLSGEIKGIFAILKLIYCGMISFSEMRGKDIPTYSEFLESYNNDEIEQTQFEGIFKTFAESKMISKVIQLPPEDSTKKKKPIIKPSAI